MQDQKHITIREALVEFERVISELEKDAVNYNKRISATEEMWKRSQVYLNEKARLIKRLSSIINAMDKLKDPDQWLLIQNSIEQLKKADEELSGVTVLIPLVPGKHNNRIAHIDLSNL